MPIGEPAAPEAAAARPRARGRAAGPAPIRVRQALPGEYAEIGRLTQAAWREFSRPEDPVRQAYFELLADVEHRAARALVLVAVLDGRLVGTATVELESTIEPDGTLAPGQANFRMLAVDPSRRNRGAGAVLVAACLQRAREAGKRVATLHTIEDMAAAARIYRAFGFVRDPSADVAIDPGTTLLAYRLEL